MTSVRRILGFLMAFTFTAFALPAFADGSDETFALLVQPAAPGTFTATITNGVGDDDRIKSFKIIAPSGVTITNAIISSSSTGYFTGYTRVPSTAPFPSGTTNVTFKNVSVKRGQTIVVTVTAALPGATTCGSSPYLWDATAYESPNASGETFKRISSDADRTTSVSNLCTLAFSRQPSSALTTATITSSKYDNTGAPVLVQLLVNGTPASSSFVTPVSLTGSCTNNPALALSGNSVTSSGGVASFGSLASSNKGAGCTLTASATGYGAPVTSYSFDVVDAELRFTAPTSLALNKPGVGVIVALFEKSTPPSVTPVPVGGSGTLSPVGCTITSLAPVPATNGVLNFDGLTASAAGTCALTASAILDGVTFTASRSLTVFQDTTSACVTTPTVIPTGSTFTATCTGTTDPVAGFAAGYRGPDKGGACAPSVNLTLTNNICNTLGTTDANGKAIPPKAVSFVWDQNYKSAFTYTVTWNPEYVDTNGLPVPGRTKFCDAATSTPCTSKSVLQACIGTDVAFTSIPPGQPACIVEEDWTVVPQANCGGTSALACIRVTTRIIDAIDPPIIRDN
jgi:hypothetical protein